MAIRFLTKTEDTMADKCCLLLEKMFSNVPPLEEAKKIDKQIDEMRLKVFDSWVVIYKDGSVMAHGLANIVHFYNVDEYLEYVHQPQNKYVLEERKKSVGLITKWYAKNKHIFN